METFKQITDKPWEVPPKPNTTPAMVKAFWHRLFRERSSQAKLEWLAGFGNVVYADPYASPFVVRLYHDDSRDQWVAYLSVVDGRVEWRFGTKASGYSKCPVATDSGLIAWLDGLFWWYIATETQQIRTRGRQGLQLLVADRIRTIRKKQGTWKRNRSY